MGAFFSASKEDEAAKAAPIREQEQAPPPGSFIEAQLDQRLAELDRRLAAQESIDAKLANLDRRMNLAEAAREKQGKEPVLEHFPDRGFGIER